MESLQNMMLEFAKKCYDDEFNQKAYFLNRISINLVIFALVINILWQLIRTFPIGSSCCHIFFYITFGLFCFALLFAMYFTFLSFRRYDYFHVPTPPNVSNFIEEIKKKRDNAQATDKLLEGLIGEYGKCAEENRKANKKKASFVRYASIFIFIALFLLLASFIPYTVILLADRQISSNKNLQPRSEQMIEDKEKEQEQKKEPNIAPEPTKEKFPDSQVITEEKKKKDK